MRYCRLGSASSEAEQHDIAVAIRAGKLSKAVVMRLAEFFNQLKALDTHGLGAVRGAWIWIGIPNLVVFTGRQENEEPTERGGQRVFAAIELDHRDRVGALIKLSCDYRGAPDEWDNNCADAIERFSKGTRVT